MEKIILKTDLNCKHCVMRVEPVLKSQPGFVVYSIDLGHPDILVILSSENADIQSVITKFNEAGYKAEIV